jgi:hypothetical protein
LNLCIIEIPPAPLGKEIPGRAAACMVGLCAGHLLLRFIANPTKKPDSQPEKHIDQKKIERHPSDVLYNAVVNNRQHNTPQNHTGTNPWTVSNVTSQRAPATSLPNNTTKCCLPFFLVGYN